MNKIRVGVIFGGRSGEHEVSLVSAASVMEALNADKYEIHPIAVDKQGRWRTGRGALHHLRFGGPAPPPCFLPADPTVAGLLVEKSGGSYSPLPLDVIFPLIHGSTGEDGALQGLLELAEIAYVGAGVLGSAVCMDKTAQKRLHKAAGIPVVDSVSFAKYEFRTEKEVILGRIESSFGYPVFVKPPNLGSSVGISRAANREMLLNAIELAGAYDRVVLVERAVPAAREIEVAVLGNSDCLASMPGEILPCNDFYDYNAKYVDGASRCIIPADLSVELTERVRSLALEAYRAAFCEGMARVDFLLSREDGSLYVNEVNTIPGFTGISMYPKLFEAAGIPYGDLLDRLLTLAIERRREFSLLRRSYDPDARWHQREV